MFHNCPMCTEICELFVSCHAVLSFQHRPQTLTIINKTGLFPNEFSPPWIRVNMDKNIQTFFVSTQIDYWLWGACDFGLYMFNLLLALQLQLTFFQKVSFNVSSADQQWHLLTRLYIYSFSFLDQIKLSNLTKLI